MGLFIVPEIDVKAAEWDFLCCGSWDLGQGSPAQVNGGGGGRSWGGDGRITLRREREQEAGGTGSRPGGVCPIQPCLCGLCPLCMSCGLLVLTPTTVLPSLNPDPSSSDLMTHLLGCHRCDINTAPWV